MQTAEPIIRIRRLLGRICILRVALLLSAWVSSAPLAPAQQLSRDQIAALRNSVAFLDCGSQQGSGFVLRKQNDVGIVVTNAHVVLDHDFQPLAVKVVLRSGAGNAVEFDGKLLASDITNDLAFVEIRGKNISEPLRIADKPDLFETQDVLLAGYPFGSDLASGNTRPQLTISKGSISSLRRWRLNTPSTIQIDANVSPGSSGGPLLNAAGEVVGVITAKVKDSQLAFASPIAELRDSMSGAVSTVTIGKLTEQGSSLLVEMAGKLVDPFHNVRQVSMRLLDKSATEADVSSLNAWPLLQSYQSVAAAKFSDQDFSMSVRIPAEKAEDGKLYAQFVCSRRDGTTYRSPVFEAAVDLLYRSPDPSIDPTPSPHVARGHTLSPKSKVVSIELGTALAPITSFPAPEASADTAADPHAGRASPPTYHVTIIPTVERSGNGVPITALPVPPHSVTSEPVSSGEWSVRRVLLPSAAMVANIGWRHDTHRLVCLSAEGAFYDLDAATGVLQQRLEVEGLFADMGASSAGFFLCARDASELMLIDHSSGRISQLMGLPRQARLLSNPASSSIYVASGEPPWGTVLQGDLQSGKYSRVYPLRTADQKLLEMDQLELAENGSVLYGATDERVCRMERKEDQFELVASVPRTAIISDGFEIRKLCCSADGKQIAVLAGVAPPYTWPPDNSKILGEIVVIDAQRLNVLARYPSPEDVPTVAVEVPGEGRWYVGGELQQLWSIGKGPLPVNIALPSIASSTTAMALSPTRKTLAVLNDDGVFLINAGAPQ